MAKLYKIHKLINSEESAQLIATDLVVAESFWQRGKGLLGKKSMTSDQVLWIKPCNNIHTFFMKFSIDCVFINKSSRVEKIFHCVKPFRIIGPVWKANSVLELAEGTVKKFDIQVGDQLYVVN